MFVSKFEVSMEFVIKQANATTGVKSTSFKNSKPLHPRYFSGFINIDPSRFKNLQASSPLKGLAGATAIVVFESAKSPALTMGGIIKKLLISRKAKNMLETFLNFPLKALLYYLRF